MKKKILICVVFLTLYLSIALNIYYLMPPKVSEDISTGYYISGDMNEKPYTLSIMRDNSVILYGHSNNVLFEGKLEFNKEENDYLITTDSQIYEVVARDDVVFLPIIENGRIISKLFTKVLDASVTYWGDGSVTYGR